MGYQTAAERAAIIRAAYKTFGWTGRDVSVRADTFSMGQAVRVQIKSPRVSLRLAERIAQQHEEIDRDQFGEILSGGNTYISVSVSGAVAEAWGKAYQEGLDRAAQKLGETTEHGTLEPILGTKGKWYLGREDGPSSAWSLWGESFEVQRFELSGIAYELAIREQEIRA